MHEVVSKWRKYINRPVEPWAFRGVWIQEFWLNCNSGKCQKKKLPPSFLLWGVLLAQDEHSQWFWPPLIPLNYFIIMGRAQERIKMANFAKIEKEKKGKKHYYSLFLSNSHNTHRCDLSGHGSKGHVLCCEPRYCCLDCVDSWPLVLFRQEINYMYDNDCLNNCLIEKRLSMGDFCVYDNKLYWSNSVHPRPFS